MQPDSADSTDLTSTKVSELGEVNMGDANVLKDFVSWGRAAILQNTMHWSSGTTVAV